MLSSEQDDERTPTINVGFYKASQRMFHSSIEAGLTIKKNFKQYNGTSKRLFSSGKTHFPDNLAEN